MRFGPIPSRPWTIFLPVLLIGLSTPLVASYAIGEDASRSADFGDFWFGWVLGTVVALVALAIAWRRTKPQGRLAGGVAASALLIAGIILLFRALSPSWLQVGSFDSAAGTWSYGLLVLLSIFGGDKSHNEQHRLPKGDPYSVEPWAQERRR
jgi:hypothetical protein